MKNYIGKVKFFLKKIVFFIPVRRRRRDGSPATAPEFTRRHSPIGEEREKVRERREHFHLEREERERQGKNEGFLPHSLL